MPLPRLFAPPSDGSVRTWYIRVCSALAASNDGPAHAPIPSTMKPTASTFRNFIRVLLSCNRRTSWPVVRSHRSQNLSMVLSKASARRETTEHRGGGMRHHNLSIEQLTRTARTFAPVLPEAAYNEVYRESGRTERRV